MRSYRSFSEVTTDAFPKPTALTIGKFDGVHLGHQAILKRLKVAADEHGLEAAVFTFTHNPLAFLAPTKCPQELSSPNQRLELLAAAGVDVTLMVDFDEHVRDLTPREYAQDVLVNLMHAQYLLVGGDFRFGKGGAGTVETLKELGAELGFSVECTSDITVNDERVSSSQVRDWLAAGDVENAERLLGRPVQVRGMVVHGAARGRELGFPTANLAESFEGLAPVDGVYAGWAKVGGERYRAAISVGGNPTFTPDAPSRVEVYLLDFAGDIYGSNMTVDFLYRLRGTERFSDIDGLIDAMNMDIDEVRRLLA
ncbi:MAG: bifunctional riboflavin kinase/FAD synthetase [Canibacter sp.]